MLGTYTVADNMLGKAERAHSLLTGDKNRLYTNKYSKSLQLSDNCWEGGGGEAV